MVEADTDSDLPRQAVLIKSEHPHKTIEEQFPLTAHHLQARRIHEGTRGGRLWQR